MATGNRKLAQRATEALTAEKGFTKTPGMCQKWLRQVVQSLYGNTYNRYFKASAYETMLAFENSPFAVKPENGSLPGDILYKGRKTSGKHGHVGIRLTGNKVAENSSYHVLNDPPGKVDARGTRTLFQYGDYELIVRLPESQ